MKNAFRRTMSIILAIALFVSAFAASPAYADHPEPTIIEPAPGAITLVTEHNITFDIFTLVSVTANSLAQILEGESQLFYFLPAWAENPKTLRQGRLMATGTSRAMAR